VYATVEHGVAGFSLDFRWIFAGFSLDFRWIFAGLELSVYDALLMKHCF
jgi:hypothetical protein